MIWPSPRTRAHGSTSRLHPRRGFGRPCSSLPLVASACRHDDARHGKRPAQGVDVGDRRAASARSGSVRSMTGRERQVSLDGEQRVSGRRWRRYRRGSARRSCSTFSASTPCGLGARRSCVFHPDGASTGAVLKLSREKAEYEIPRQLVQPAGVAIAAVTTKRGRRGFTLLEALRLPWALVLSAFAAVLGPHLSQARSHHGSCRRPGSGAGFC